MHVHGKCIMNMMNRDALDFKSQMVGHVRVHVNTAKLIYKGHPRDQQNVVLIHVIHRWSLSCLCRLNNMKSIPLGTCKHGEMWSLYAGGF